MPKKILICDYCGIEFNRYVYTETIHHFCCKEHYTMFIKETDKFSGENNSNFGKKWSEGKKLEQSDKIKQVMNEKGEKWRKENCGKSNRGKKRSKEFLDNWISFRRDPDFKFPEITNETREKIRKASSERMSDPNFKQKLRETNEKRGNWVPLNEKSDFQIYYKIADWQQRMWDLIEDEHQLQKLKTLGVFNARSNSKGVVRDHIYGRYDGFRNRVFPEILRHPCNCQILLHSENVGKKNKRYIDKSEITLEQLFFNIENFNGEWFEQELVLNLISQYRHNKRWERQYE